jgi:hypothetical protein
VKLAVAGDVASTGLYWGGSSLSSDQGGSIELGNSTSSGGESSYIDFHYGNGSSEDHNVRLINAADGVLACQGNFAVVSRTEGSALVQLGEGLDYAEDFDVARPEPCVGHAAVGGRAIDKVGVKNL